jgi:CO/xanthine dehydrogenase Mo-binding subunit
MEPQNCTVAVTGRTAEVWAPCQSPTLVQAFVADAIGGDREQVIVHTTLSGGGFGRRIVADFATQAALIAKQVKRPVKLSWSRESDMTQASYRPQSTVVMQGGLAASDELSAMSAHCISQSITLSSGPILGALVPGPRAMKGVVVDSLLAMFASNSVGDLFATEGIKDTPYQIPNLRVDFTPMQRLSDALDQEITVEGGVVQQRNFDTFPALRMFEAPDIIVQILETDHHPTGVGEPGLPPIAAAVAIAIFALTGTRLRRLPLQHAGNERGAK